MLAAREQLLELFSRNNDYGFLSCFCDILRPFGASPAEKFAETRLSGL
jgi:hypothetical protein